MARPKYRITASDHWFARRWVEKKLINPTWLGEIKTFSAHQDFLNRQETAEELNKWCESWLSSGEWTQLKNAVRTSRKRARGSEKISVTLSRYSWSILDFWARREGCTLSKVIERHMGAGNPVDFASKP